MKSTKNLHNLLRRQLRKHLSYETVPKELDVFITAINDAYLQSDADREMLEHSLDLCSKELLHANAELNAILKVFPDLFLIIDEKGVIIDSRGGGEDDFLSEIKFVGKNIQEIPFDISPEDYSEISESLHTDKSLICLDYSMENGNLFYEARLLPLSETRILMIIRNITERIKAEQEREEMIKDLQDALNEVRTLKEIIPICSSCKKIRDDDGFWKRVENYVTTHFDTQFTHSYCPDCYKEAIDKLKKIKRQQRKVE